MHAGASSSGSAALEASLQRARADRNEKDYFESARKAQFEALGGLFGFNPPAPPAYFMTPPPPPTAAPSDGAVSSGVVSGGAGMQGGSASAVSGVSIAPRACAPSELGCLQSDRARATAARTAYMVPWTAPSSLGADAAAVQLQRALRAEGGTEIRVASAANGARRVTAQFAAGPLGLPVMTDEIEFVIVGSLASFRASASGAPLPFSTPETATQRNRARLLRVRGQLFASHGWSCACPPDAGLSCTLFCD